MGHSTTPQTPEYYTIAEIAARLRVSKMTVYRMANAGELPGAIRVGARTFRVHAVTFDLALAEQLSEEQDQETV